MLFSSTIIPAFRYRRAKAAIRWLCDVLGFEEHLIVPGPGDTIAHAQLRRTDAARLVSSVDQQ